MKRKHKIKWQRPEGFYRGSPYRWTARIGDKFRCEIVSQYDEYGIRAYRIMPNDGRGVFTSLHKIPTEAKAKSTGAKLLAEAIRELADALDGGVEGHVSDKRCPTCKHTSDPRTCESRFDKTDHGVQAWGCWEPIEKGGA